MELAYLTTEYPAVSHIFIRREILGLENLGHTIHRYSIQDCKNISDPVDELERKKTFCCLSQDIFKLLLNGISCSICAPVNSLNAPRLTLDFSRKKLLSTSPEKLNEMGDRGHDLVKSSFSTQSQIPILEKYFEAALTNKESR